MFRNRNTTGIQIVTGQEQHTADGAVARKSRAVPIYCPGSLEYVVVSREAANCFWLVLAALVWISVTIATLYPRGVH